MFLLSTTHLFQTQPAAFKSFGRYAVQTHEKSGIIPFIKHGPTKCMRFFTSNQVNSVDYSHVVQHSMPLIAMGSFMNYQTRSSTFRSKRNECTRSDSAPVPTSDHSIFIDTDWLDTDWLYKLPDHPAVKLFWVAVKLFWVASEDPLRYFITFVKFSYIAMTVVPATIAQHQIVRAWSGAFVLSFIWFLYRFEASIPGQTSIPKSLELERFERQATVMTNVVMFACIIIILADLAALSVELIQTVGATGLGGLAIAFSATDIAPGNFLGCLFMLLSKPFSHEHTTKAIAIESPGQSHALVTKIPIQIKMLGKIPEISEDIKTMLKSNTKFFLDKEPPYCFLSRIESSFAELTLGFNLKLMVPCSPPKFQLHG